MQHNMTTGSWNEDNTARLRELWSEGLPAAESAAGSASPKTP
jgi:hypothetical protein